MRGVARSLGSRFTAADVGSLKIWAASRLGMTVLAWIGGWIFLTDHNMPGPWLGRWNRWDAGIFQQIADKGYFAPGADPSHVAFFPGFPWALSWVHLVVRNWVVAGLVVSLVASAFAVLALARIAGDYANPGPSPRVEATAEATVEYAVAVTARTEASSNAVLFFLLAPAAVFLAAGYSESLFAAFAFPAWHAARRNRWLLAVVLAAGASAVRVNGLFLAAALVLEFLLAGRNRRSWRQLPLLAVPVVPVLVYMAYLHAKTDDWMAWHHAQETGWFRTFSDPQSAWNQTWNAAFGGSQEGHTAWVFQLELVAVVTGILLTLWLVARRRWPEALYVSLSLLALSTTTWFMSVPRAMLLWWPLWAGLGTWAVRRPIVRSLYVCCVGPMAVALALLYLSGQWAG